MSVSMCAHQQPHTKWWRTSHNTAEHCTTQYNFKIEKASCGGIHEFQASSILFWPLHTHAHILRETHKCEFLIINQSKPCLSNLAWNYLQGHCLYSTECPCRQHEGSSGQAECEYTETHTHTEYYSSAHQQCLEETWFPEDKAWRRLTSQRLTCLLSEILSPHEPYLSDNLTRTGKKGWADGPTNKRACYTILRPEFGSQNPRKKPGLLSGTSL